MKDMLAIKQLKGKI